MHVESRGERRRTAHVLAATAGRVDDRRALDRLAVAGRRWRPATCPARSLRAPEPGCHAGPMGTGGALTAAVPPRSANDDQMSVKHVTAPHTGVTASTSSSRMSTSQRTPVMPPTRPMSHASSGQAASSTGCASRSGRTARATCRARGSRRSAGGSGDRRTGGRRPPPHVRMRRAAVSCSAPPEGRRPERPLATSPGGRRSRSHGSSDRRGSTA